MTTETDFHVYGEDLFEGFLQYTSFFVRPVEYTPETDFKANFKEIVNRLRSRRMFAAHYLKPFYADARFMWVLAIEGEEKEQKITGVALLRFPNEYNAKGEILYIDTEDKENIAPLVALHEEASQAAGTWESGTFPLNLAQWSDSLNAEFLKFIEKATVRDDIFA